MTSAFQKADAAVFQAIERNSQSQDGICDVIKNAGEENDIESLLEIGCGTLEKRAILRFQSVQIEREF
jgi:hypothetical protein